MTDLVVLVERLLKAAPETNQAEAVQREIEHVLMTSLAEGGRESGEKVVESLSSAGYKLTRLDALPCMWRVSVPEPRVLEVWFTGGDSPVVAALSYRKGTPWGTAKDQSAAASQKTFYSRYEEVAALRDQRRSPEDRLILAIGEFEADVNNGGFEQYLENKGVTRARRTLAHLRRIGAGGSASSLAAVLASPSDRASFERADQQFHQNAEDLASLTMAYLEGTANAE